MTLEAPRTFSYYQTPAVCFVSLKTKCIDLTRFTVHSRYVVGERHLRGSALDIGTTNGVTMAPLGLLDLPVEVRHNIYSHLFKHTGQSIWIHSPYRGLLFPSSLSEPREPVFHTQIFRTSKAICADTISFAYGTNDLVLQDSCHSAFCGLSRDALASIKDLTVIHHRWVEETSVEQLAWERIRDNCTGLS